MTDIEGGCQCGAVRYRVSLEKVVGYACHCLECQKQSASAFGLSVPIPAEQLRIDGAMGCYRRDTDSGSSMNCWFCATCGSRLYHQSVDESDWVSLKGGTLDQPDLLNPAAHIWVKRKRPWVLLSPDIPAYDTEPDDFDAWRESLLAQRSG